MKTNFKRIGKQSISIVLAVMMMLSTMLVGMVTSNAAERNTTIYFAYSGSYELWPENWGGTEPGYWYQATAVSGKTFEGKQVYSCDLFNDSTGINVHFKSGDTVTGNIQDIVSGDSINNYTSKIYVVNDAGNGGEWKDYSTSTTTHKVTANFSNATVKLGGNTLTSGTPKTVDNNTNYTLTVTPDKGYTLTSVKFGDTEKDTSGNYTYNCSSDTTITITTEATSAPVGDIVVYFANPIDNGWGTVCNYIWNTSGNPTPTKAWPGDELTKVCQSDYSYKNVTYTVYKVTVPAAYDSIIFNNNNNGVQTGNIQGKILADRNLYIYNQSSQTANVDIIENYTEPTTNTDHSVTYTPPTGDGVVNDSINPKDTTLAEGTNVTVTVTVNKGYTASLAVEGTKVTTSISDNTYTFTFSMPAQDITVAPKVTKAGENTGTLIPNLYLIYTTANDGNPTGFTEFLNLYYDSNNQVYAYFKDTELDTSKNYKFMISTLTGKNSFEGTTNYNKDNHNVNVTTTDDNSIQVGKNEYGYSDNHRYFYGWFSVKNPSQSTVSSVKINLGYYNKTTGVIQENATDTSYTHSYEVIPISGVEGMIQVFAKDGTIRDGYQKYADMADTVLTAENTADLTKYNNKNKYYETAYAKVGTKLKITTTIGDDYKGKYFVKAFSINGYSYGIIDASQADTTNGVYTCEYTIPEDFEGKRIEITPIYYYIDDTDTVTFYVEGFEGEVQKMWGNTVAVHAWYANCEKEDDVNNSKFDSPTKNALGGYPGQPLVYQGGKYSMQIPKCLNGNKDNYVKGITLNNYFWDNIHKQNFDDQSNTSKFNCQTYDYDDFYKLSESPDVDNIIFDFRYRTTDDNDKEGNKPGVDLNSSTYNKRELEPLKDYSGNIVDIFGNILSEDWTDDYDSKYLTVISDGYKVNEVIGHYATEWSVYDHAGNRIAQINCSSLIDPSKVDPAYQEAYNTLKDYAKLPVKIAYEKSITKGTQLGTRADGRWYFSKKADQISAKVEIEYGADSNSTFSTDEFLPDSNEGKNTGAKAYFTNADYSGKTTCKGTVDGGNFSVHAQTDANAKYYFLGWYLKTSDGYSFITNESDADIPMTNNATYVARFINTPSGTLTLSHTLLTDSADGKTFIKADIVDSDGNVIKPFEETSGNIVISPSYVNYTNGYSIKVTLRTKPYGKDTVEGFYEGYNSDTPTRYTDAILTGAGEQTHSVTREIKDLFDPSSFKLIKSNIPFYSNIKSNPLEYTITYTYDTRRDGRQSYVIKDTVSGAELDEMWAQNVAAGLKNKEQLSKAFIIKKAPFVSNYREVITWDMDKATIKDYTATVLATTDPVKLNISALTVAGSWTAPAPVEYGELALSSNGDYLYKTGTNEFPETFNYSGTTDYAFSFWAIFDNPDAAQKYSDEVAKYMSGTPATNMSERLTDLTTRDGYKYLISKSYSKEYNYVSYQNYYIVPVYAGRFAKNEINELQASIRLLEYTRNQWTTGNGVKGDGTPNVDGSKTDYLYTDFALSFDKNQLLIQNNPNIKVGVAFEIVARYDAVKPLDSYATDSDEAAIRKLVKDATDSSKDNGKVGAYEMVDKSRSVYRYEIDNSKISEKNRIEYYLRFNNTKNAQQNVMKVYSYIYDTQKNEIYLSDPEYMNMYDIGNLTYITSGLASNDLQPATELG